MEKHIIDDAKRCLQCKNPRCSEGCPLHTPIRDAIRLLLNSGLEQAGEMLFENNPLSIICSHVCPQENQCEGHCVMNKSGAPVHISAIEQYISDFYLNIYRPHVTDKTAGKVAIIGSGPAGLTIAFRLLSKNYDITIYEGQAQVGGTMRYGIPEFRLPKKYLDQLSDLLIKSGAKIRPNTTIGANLTVDDLFRDGYDAVFMGTGVWRPQKLNILGESLGHVHYAIEYLHNPDMYRLGESLTIIGAGNVAMDVARTAIRHNCHHVTIVCNRDEVGMTAREIELQYATIDGAKIIYNKTVTEFCEGGVMLADSEYITDEEGNLSVVSKEGTKTLVHCDSVIIAIGQKPRAVIVSSTSGINITEDGLVEVDEYGRTTREGVFAAGDVTTGAKTVIEAVKMSKKVAEAIDSTIKERRTQQ